MEKRKQWMAILTIAALLLVTLLGGIVNALAGDDQAADAGGTATVGEPGEGMMVLTDEPQDEPGICGDGDVLATPDPQVEEGATGESGGVAESSQEDLSVLCWPPPAPQGKICVVKFLDLDEDGKMDTGESGMPGITIKLDGGTPKTTDSNGMVCYEGLGEDRYTVSEVVPAGYRATTETSYPVEIHSHYSTFCSPPPCSYDTVTVFFGNTPVEAPEYGSISGHKYNDLDGDGVLDPGEPALAGVRIELWQGSTMVDWTTTAADGSYFFVDLDPGTYDVKEVLTSEWVATNPTDGSHDDIAVAEGQDITDLDFLNKKKLCREGKVEVLVFEDSNCSGVLDGGDELTTMAVEIELYHYMDGMLVPADGWDGSYQKPTGAGPSWWPVYPDGCASWQTLPCREIPPGTDVYGDYVVKMNVPGGWTALEVNWAGKTYTTEFGTFHLQCIFGMPTCTWQQIKFLITDIPPGTLFHISGHKYEDLDGDGALDPGEPGLEGWTVELWQGDTKVAETATGAGGYYIFDNLPHGVYDVKEVLQAGWSPTNPADGVHDDVAVGCGDNVENLDFLNRREHCSISGHKYNDLDGDGALDPGEPALAGVRIELWQGSTMVDWTTTEADGSYFFGDLDPGTYDVKEVLDPGWFPTNPADGVHDDVVLGSGGDIENLDFLNREYGSISGHKYNDLDGDGALDPGEPALAGVRIELWQGSTMVDWTTTEADGSYFFGDLDPGTYDVKEVLDPGWFPTNPADGVHDDVVLGSGGDIENLDFLNREYGHIRGVKFLDLDEDGIMDPAEEGLDGVTIILNPGSLTTVTAGGGHFAFEYLEPGLYEVAVDESSLPGYYPTGDTSIMVDLAPGETETVYFGNAPYGSISGHKWLDADLDGVWDAGETVTIPGVTIKLYEGDPPVGDPIATMDTGLDGSYAFPNLEAGTYTLVEEAEEGYFPTTSTTFVVELSPGEGAEVDFGNCPYSRIDGFKFEDLDGDGILDATEEGLEGVTIKLWMGTTQVGETTTDEDGTFSFENLLPGSYKVSETLPSGYYATLPPDAEVEVDLTPGDEATVLFGNAPYGSISGHKWLDDNLNGAIDSTDLPLAGITIKLEGTTLGGVPVSFSTTTLADGSYSFDLIEAGVYKVSEELDTTKYYNVFDTSMDVTLAPGEDRKDIDFLNADVPVGGEVVTPPTPAVAGGTTALPATGMEQLPLLLLAVGFVLAGLVLMLLGLRRRYQY